MTDGHVPRDLGRSVFGVDPGGYHAARIDYPDELYRLITDRTADGDFRSILEIGAGTGLATTALLPIARERYVAVEPDPTLANYLRQAFSQPIFEIVEADFVGAPIAGTFDLVAAASSFHWLEPQAALDKIWTLLRPGGSIALWWNSYRNPGIGDAFADATLPLLAGLALPPSESDVGHYSLDTHLHRSRLAAAGFARIDHRLFRRERRLSATEVRRLYASYSFVRTLAPDRQATLLDAIAALVEDEFGGSSPNVVLTAIYVASRPA